MAQLLIKRMHLYEFPSTDCYSASPEDMTRKGRTHHGWRAGGTVKSRSRGKDPPWTLELRASLLNSATSPLRTFDKQLAITFLVLRKLCSGIGHS